MHIGCLFNSYRSTGIRLVSTNLQIQHLAKLAAACNRQKQITGVVLSGIVIRREDRTARKSLLQLACLLVMASVSLPLNVIWQPALASAS
jgi:hypothetical protein